MREIITTAVLVSVVLFSCKKDDTTKKEDTSTSNYIPVTPKAKAGSFVIDGIEYKPSVQQAKADGDDYIVEGRASSGGLSFLQVRFGEKPAVGTYGVEPGRPAVGGSEPATNGKFSIYTWGTEAGGTAWTTDSSAGDAIVNIDGQKVNVVINEMKVKRADKDTSHIISVNFSAILE